MRRHFHPWIPVLGALLLAGCPQVPTDDRPGGIVIYDAGSGGGLDGGVRQNRPVMSGEVAPMYGFISKNARAEYYYLGEVDKGADGKVPINKMYFFYDETGSPLFRLSQDGSEVVGWHPLVDVVPTKAGYSPFFKVVRVRVKGRVDQAAMTSLTCDPGKTLCPKTSTCKNLRADVKNCGKCGSACKTGQFCSAGACKTIVCAGGLTLCGDTCKNLKTDATACGSCSTACKAGEACVAGSCKSGGTCRGGTWGCKDESGETQCVDLNSDKDNCGDCTPVAQTTFGGTKCSDKQSCVRGQCTLCGGGNVVCDGNCANLQNDLNNCGSCGTRCSGDQRCFDGVCSFGKCQMNAVCPGDLECVQGRCTDPIKVGIFPIDGIKSLESLNESNLVLDETSLLLNCPIVDADAKLLKGLAAPDTPYPKMQLWYKRLKAFCFLAQGGKELLGRGAPAVSSAAVLGKPIDAYFIRRKLDFGGSEKVVVLAKRNAVITDKRPGEAGYSPLVNEYSVYVDKDHEFRDIRSVAEAKKLSPSSAGRLHNLVLRGEIPACTSDVQCAATGGLVDPPLKCSVESGYCSPPFARLGEECRRGVKECDPAGGPKSGRLACVGLRVRDKYFCFHACDSSKSDGNADKDIDTRCGSRKGFRCYALRQTDPNRPNGVCIQICNSRAGNKEALLKECESPTCGDGKLDHGEVCDDGNRIDGDGCNKYCTLTTFDRCTNASDCKGDKQVCKAPVAGFTGENTYCLPPAGKEKDESVESGKYRSICMEFNYCWPPDDRAEWLGKKEEGQ